MSTWSIRTALAFPLAVALALPLGCAKKDEAQPPADAAAAHRGAEDARAAAAGSGDGAAPVANAAPIAPGVSASRTGTSPPNAAPPATSVRTPWVKARNAEEVSMLEAPATVLTTPESNAGVSPPFRARVVRVRVKPGEKVKRGEPVADVVMPEVVQAAGTYVSAATRVTAYAKRAAQLAGLRKEGMVRISELLEVETKLAEARADQHGALAMLRVAGLDAADATKLLASQAGEVALRSPIDGVVTQVKASIGENREAAGEPLVRIAGEGDPRVEARLVRILPRAAEYELVLPSGEQHPLRAVGRAPQVDPRDGTTLVWFAPLGPAKLVQGQTGKLRIRFEEEEGVVAVPARAVGLGPKGPFVVAHEGGRAAQVEVEVLAASGAEALVKGRLRIGDEVAADAALTELGAAADAARPPPPDQDAARDKEAARGRGGT